MTPFASPPGSKGCCCTGIRRRNLLLVLAFVLSVTGFTQQKLEGKILGAYAAADSDSSRIMVLRELSDYYYGVREYARGDSVIEKMIMLADASMSQGLALMAYFGNAGYQSTGAATKHRSRVTRDYIQRAMAYARARGLLDYTAMAYGSLSALHNSNGESDEALKFANQGFTTALGTANDSAKVICAIHLGNVYLLQSDLITAYKTFSNALNIAMLYEDRLLLPPVLHAMASLYKKLGINETARGYVFRSYAFNKERKNLRGQITDQIFLAKLSNYAAAKDYLQQSIALADSIHDAMQRMEAHRILFSYMLLQEKPSYMLTYLEDQQEVENMFANTGPDYLNWVKAEIFLYGGMPDSALHYFRQAELSFNTGYDLLSKRNFFGEYAACYQQLQDIPAAITYYERSAQYSREAADLQSLKTYTFELKQLYSMQHDYEKAYRYSELYDQYKDSADLLSRERDLAMMEIEAVALQQQREEEQAKDDLRRKYNLQYMLITIIVATVFVLMIMVGAFRVSAFTIRAMGFFSLIFLFEFIILILEKWIHGITHGEPWKSWLIKIGIISILLPIHHYVEHRLIHYLLSRHLLKVRSRIALSRLFGRKSKPPPTVSGEEITTHDDREPG